MLQVSFSRLRIRTVEKRSLSFRILGYELGNVFQGRGDYASSAIRPAGQPCSRANDTLTELSPPYLPRRSPRSPAISIHPIARRERYTAMAIQLKYSIPGNTGVVRLGTTAKS